MPENKTTSKQCIGEQGSARGTGAQHGARNTLKKKKKNEPEKSNVPKRSARIRANNVTVRDLLKKLNMLQYLDNLDSIGCDSIETAIFANVDDLVTDAHMRKIHAKIFVKAAKKIMEKQRSSSTRRKKGGL